MIVTYRNVHTRAKFLDAAHDWTRDTTTMQVLSNHYSYVLKM